MEPEAQIRLGFFFGVFALMALWELAAPRREFRTPRSRRWFSNLSLVVIDAVLVRVVFPFSATVLAEIAPGCGWGLFNYVAWPPIVEIVLAIIALDFIIYLQHVMFHAVPVLWRMHMVHHADPDFDVTTGVRFHPLEIIVSMAIKFAAIVLLGPSPVAVVAFEVVLNATSMFNHSNVRIPPALDRLLRWIVVTPDMHRVHHSVDVHESNCNFGFNLPWWDRLCGTYEAHPAAGHVQMTIGLRRFRDALDQRLSRLLVMPFARLDDDRSIGRRVYNTERNDQSTD